MLRFLPQRDRKRSESRICEALQIARRIGQLMHKGDILVRELSARARVLFGGVRKFAEYLGESLRTFAVEAEAMSRARRMRVRLDTT